ncbi:Hsp20/alpha crystallin family protein [Rufibacter glacialis]|uniref:Hsp20/alpha crystallin family protein n=1 Tax=Rufibacter glacialis TaxID=1259555 RepID=A0A5M8QM93_9BACT|nr:Hsp20/alpha crystallin family protein [Rufibacter glacialis]KAA6437347.1 Hsp20/alpha crystallin family protein [Rufibacter glacialis]GGK60060.1 hypothetical protein GCM10011405_05210 [Rufibacter glacialis]
MITAKQNPGVTNRGAHAFSSLLDSFYQDSVNQRRGQGFTPAVDLWETESSYEVELVLPGVTKENITVEFEEGVLRVSGERAFKKENQQLKYHRVENLYGKFRRSFQLPEHVDAAAIQAQFENGVLHVSVPKVEEKVVKHQISVK